MKPAIPEKLIYTYSNSKWHFDLLLADIKPPCEGLFVLFVFTMLRTLTKISFDSFWRLRQCDAKFGTVLQLTLSFLQQLALGLVPARFTFFNKCTFSHAMLVIHWLWLHAKMISFHAFSSSPSFPFPYESWRCLFCVTGTQLHTL